jgi:Mn2+/Fe2+ NRAMP family transporter
MLQFRGWKLNPRQHLKIIHKRERIIFPFLTAVHNIIVLLPVQRQRSDIMPFHHFMLCLEVWCLVLIASKFIRLCNEILSQCKTV